MLLAGGAVAYKLSKKDAQQIEQHTGVPPEELSEEELTGAMSELGIESQPMTAEDRAAMEGGEEYYDDVPAADSDYLDELERLADLRDKGIITEEDFQAKKKQLLEL